MKLTSGGDVTITCNLMLVCFTILVSFTGQKMKFSITIFFSKYDQIRKENFIFCAVTVCSLPSEFKDFSFHYIAYEYYWTVHSTAKKIPFAFSKTFKTHILSGSCCILALCWKFIGMVILKEGNIKFGWISYYDAKPWPDGLDTSSACLTSLNIYQDYHSISDHLAISVQPSICQKSL